jgi:hypothetical protein
VHPRPISPLLLGSLLVAAWAGLMACDPIRQHPGPATAIFLAATLIYAVACRDLLRDPSRWTLKSVLVVGVLCRLIALPGSPSDDMHRYLWEGRVQAAGYNPYRLAPDDPALSELASIAPEHEFINHPDWTAIYPPLTQLWQRAAVSVHASVWALKLSFVLAEAVLMCALLWWLRRRGLPAVRLAVYAWNPLAVWATSYEGHHDVLAAAALLTALALAENGRRTLAALCFTCAVLTKGFALVALPALLPHRARASEHLSPHGPLRRRAHAWAPLVASLGLALLLSTPYLLQGGGLTGSLRRFADEMHYNDSLHALARGIFGADVAHGLLVVGLVGTAIHLVRRGLTDRLKTAAVLLGALLLSLPTVHPWYLMALLPFLCMRPWWGWLCLTGTVALTWLPLAEVSRTGRWVEWRALTWIEYAPLFLWLSWCAWQRGTPDERTRDGRLPAHLPSAQLSADRQT